MGEEKPGCVGRSSRRTRNRSGRRRNISGRLRTPLSWLLEGPTEALSRVDGWTAGDLMSQAALRLSCLLPSVCLWEAPFQE